MSEQVSSNLKKVTLSVERDAKVFCAVLTGTLKRSITHKFIGNHEAIVGSNIEYAPHVELGTVKWSGKPFLRPALAKNMKDIKKILK